MQNNVITIGELDYGRFKETPDKTTYTSSNHKVSSTDLMLLGRTIATSDTANAKSRANFVRDLKRGDAANTTGRAYFNVECAYPQWASDADLQAITDTVAAFLSSAEFNNLVKKQSI